MGLVVAAGLCAPSLAVAEPCQPTVALEGDDADMITELSAILTARGVDVSSQSDCGVVSVVLASRDGRLVVGHEFADGAEERTVDDIAAAATAIEAWVRTDLAAPMLAARPVAVVRPPVAAIEAPAVTVERPAAPVADVRTLELSLASELGLGLDGSTWTGLVASGCVNVRVLCIGVSVRGAIDNRTSGDSKRLDGSRYALDTLLTVDVPFRGQSWSLYPGIGIGQGFQVAVANAVDDQDDLGGVRVRGHIGFALRLSRNTSLLVSPEVVWSPGSPQVVLDIDEEDGPVTYPGDPGLHFRVGIGLLWGAL